MSTIELTADPTSTVSGRERLESLLGERRSLMVALAVSSIISGLAESFMLVALAQIAATIAGKHKHGQMIKIPVLHLHGSTGQMFAYAAAFAVVRLIMQWPLSHLPARIGAEVQAKLRSDLSHAYSRASWAEQSNDREGHLQETMTTQVLQASQGALQASTLLAASLNFTILMITALAVNAKAALVVLFVAMFLLAALRPLNRLGSRRARQLSRAQLSYAGSISEMVRVSEETHVFGVDAPQRDRVDRFISGARDMFYRAQLVVRLAPNIYQSVVYLMLIAGLAALYAINHSELGSLGSVILLLFRAAGNGQQVQGAWQGLRQSLPFIERVQEATKRYERARPEDGLAPLARVDSIVFDHVSFAYREGRDVLAEVSFEVGAGEAIGVIGPSGAGKSTLVQILLQLRTPTAGHYLVNGEPATSFERGEWNRSVTYVPQEPKLVHASVADNIRFFREGISDEDVERAARLARIHDVIMEWPDGYREIVGPRADAVSGGQQQRICLARALAARPDVLVLDEPTSALDPQSEVLIQESLAALRSELTIFIVAHRMSTLDICDRVMIVLDGRLVAFDRIDVLEQESAYYRNATAIASGGELP